LQVTRLECYLFYSGGGVGLAFRSCYDARMDMRLFYGAAQR